MKTEHRSKDPSVVQGVASAPAGQPIYQIRIEGHLGKQWADWFEGLAIHREKKGTTVLTGPMADSDTLPIRLSPIWADDLRRPKGPRTHALLPPLQDCRALNETLWLLGEV